MHKNKITKNDANETWFESNFTPKGDSHIIVYLAFQLVIFLSKP